MDKEYEETLANISTQYSDPTPIGQLPENERKDVIKMLGDLVIADYPHDDKNDTCDFFGNTIPDEVKQDMKKISGQSVGEAVKTLKATLDKHASKLKCFDVEKSPMSVYFEKEHDAL